MTGKIADAADGELDAAGQVPVREQLHRTAVRSQRRVGYRRADVEMIIGDVRCAGPIQRLVKNQPDGSVGGQTGDGEDLRRCWRDGECHRIGVRLLRPVRVKRHRPEGGAGGEDK